MTALATNDLTVGQRRVLRWAAAYIRRHGYAPTYREIQRGCRLKSVRSVAQYVNVLQRKGYLTRDAGISRSLALAETQ